MLHYVGLIGYVVVYGACDGIYWTMLTIVVVDSVGERLRAVAFGMQQFLNSITLPVGPPLAGEFQR